MLLNDSELFSVYHSFITIFICYLELTTIVAYDPIPISSKNAQDTILSIEQQSPLQSSILCSEFAQLDHLHPVKLACVFCHLIAVVSAILDVIKFVFRVSCDVLPITSENNFSVHTQTWNCWQTVILVAPYCQLYHAMYCTHFKKYRRKHIPFNCLVRLLVLHQDAHRSVFYIHYTVKQQRSQYIYIFSTMLYICSSFTS